MATPTPQYVIYKRLPNGASLVRRTTDGETLIAHPFDLDTTAEPALAPVAELIRRGAGDAAAHVLNHENLVSAHTELVLERLPANPGTAPRPRTMLVWDYCDAGTVAHLFAEPLLAPVTATGFLPESLVWHVALSVLRALQWLHEGVRDVYDIDPPRGWAEDQAVRDEVYAGRRAFRCVRVRGTEKVDGEKDWLPILHRRVFAENIFLQHPRGIETYGPVKLGNFARCVVAARVGKVEDGPIVAMEEGDVDSATVRERWLAWEVERAALPRKKRPYTQGSEMYDLGRVIFQMMTGTPPPQSEECSQPGCTCVHFKRVLPDKTEKDTHCPHNCAVKDFYLTEYLESLTDYTEGLRTTLYRMLLVQRDDQFDLVRASAMLDQAWHDYIYWTEETEDGRLYRDTYDDMWIRELNQHRKDKERREREKKYLGIQDQDRMEVDGEAEDDLVFEGEGERGGKR